MEFKNISTAGWGEKIPACLPKLPHPTFASGYQITELPLNKPVFLNGSQKAQIHSQGKPGFYKFCDHSCQALQPLLQNGTFSFKILLLAPRPCWLGYWEDTAFKPPYNVLMDDVLVRCLTFHIKDIKQQPKRSWQQKAISFSTRYLLVEGPKKIWFAMELAPSDLP